jgi:hypothetical protein
MPRASHHSDATKAVACVIDLDNLLHRGIERTTNQSRPQAGLDVLALRDELRKRGVTRGTVCRNRPFPLLAELIWKECGLEPISTRRNCDPEVVKEIEMYADSGIGRLILASGDGDYCPIVKKLRRRGIPVEIWARRKATASSLVSTASRVRWLDRPFRRTPTSPLNPAIVHPSFSLAAPSEMDDTPNHASLKQPLSPAPPGRNA